MNRVDTIGATVSQMTKALNGSSSSGAWTSGSRWPTRRNYRRMRRVVDSAERDRREQNRNLSLTMASFRRAASAVDSASIDSTLKNFEVEARA